MTQRLSTLLIASVVAVLYACLLVTAAGADQTVTVSTPSAWAVPTARSAASPAADPAAQRLIRCSKIMA